MLTISSGFTHIVWCSGPLNGRKSAAKQGLTAATAHVKMSAEEIAMFNSNLDSGPTFNTVGAWLLWCAFIALLALLMWTFVSIL
jgi:hypothetical protein